MGLRESAIECQCHGPRDIVFVVDVPGWSLDAFARRVGPGLGLDWTVHNLFPSLDAWRSGEEAPDYAGVPRADVVYCTSWWFLVQLIVPGLGLPPQGPIYVADVVDESSWKLPQFECIPRVADLVCTQSLAYFHANPTALFHPYPSRDDWRQRPRRPRDPDGKFRIGMVANGFASHGGGADHKGVWAVRRAMESMGPEVVLEVAGTDRMIDHEAMPEWYDSLDLFVCASQSEGFSAAVVDAMTCGCPLASTDVSPRYPFVTSATDALYMIPRIPVPSTAYDDPGFGPALVDAVRRTSEIGQWPNRDRLLQSDAEPWSQSLVAKQLRRAILGAWYDRGCGRAK